MRAARKSTLAETDTAPTARIQFRKYTSLSALIHLLHSREITLLDPEKWDDKNDSHFMLEYKEIVRAKNVLATCFAECEETYHHWRVFANGADGVCIEFDKLRLLAAFEGAVEIKKRTVRYARLSDLRSRASFPADDLLFLKRKPFEPEAEFRVVYVDFEPPEVPAVTYEIDLAAIRRVTLSPWMNVALRRAIRETLQRIPGCEALSVVRSTLIGNREWQSMADKAVVPRKRKVCR